MHKHHLYKDKTEVVASAHTVQKQNKTGLPDQLKSGIEQLSGHSMDDVKVHYNSNKPSQLSAHAYAQGSDIHVASGQERHLPHEAWHVAQQKQGRVKPTTKVNGVAVNDNKGLEREADIMGSKAASTQLKKYTPAQFNTDTYIPVTIAQRVTDEEYVQLKKHFDMWQARFFEMGFGERWMRSSPLVTLRIAKDIEKLSTAKAYLDREFSKWLDKLERIKRSSSEGKMAPSSPSAPSSSHGTMPMSAPAPMYAPVPMPMPAPAMYAPAAPMPAAIPVAASGAGGSYAPPHPAPAKHSMFSLLHAPSQDDGMVDGMSKSDYLAALDKQAEKPEKPLGGPRVTTSKHQFRPTGATISKQVNGHNNDCVLAAFRTVKPGINDDALVMKMTSTEEGIALVAHVYGMRTVSKKVLVETLRSGGRAFINVPALGGGGYHAYAALGIDVETGKIIAWDTDNNHADIKLVPIELVWLAYA